MEGQNTYSESTITQNYLGETALQLRATHHAWVNEEPRNERERQREREREKE